MHSQGSAVLTGRFSLKRTKRGIIAALLAVTLGGCSSSTIQTYNKLDLSNKTMTVPADNTLLTGLIKQRLPRNGWALADESGTPLTTGINGPTRYRLTITQSRRDVCNNGQPLVAYHLVLYDNKTHDAILTEDGRDCINNAAGRFIVALRSSGSH